MELTGALSKVLDSSKDTRRIETNFLEIRGNLVRCENTVIQMSNISMITTTDSEKIPFPTWSFIFVVFGIILLFSKYIIGLLLVVIFGCITADWVKNMQKLEHIKKLKFLLNSGITYTIVFNDLVFLDKVVNVFIDILAQPEHNQNIYFDIKDNSMKIINGDPTINNIHDNSFLGQSSAVKN